MNNDISMNKTRLFRKLRDYYNSRIFCFCLTAIKPRHEPQSHCKLYGRFFNSICVLPSLNKGLTTYVCSSTYLPASPTTTFQYSPSKLDCKATKPPDSLEHGELRSHFEEPSHSLIREFSVQLISMITWSFLMKSVLRTCLNFQYINRLLLLLLLLLILYFYSPHEVFSTINYIFVLFSNYYFKHNRF